MSAELIKKENSTVEIKFSVDNATFQDGIKKAYSKSAGKFNIPGFRKGKAPQKMVEQYYGQAVFYDDAINIVLPDAYDKAVKELSLEPVDKPEIDVEDFAEKGDIVFTAKMTVKPDVKLGKYKGIETKKIEYNVTDDDVNAEVDKLRERNSRMVTVDDRAIAKDDIANINFEGFKDGVAFNGGKGENYDLTIGSGQFIPGFEDQLIGKNIGEDVVVNVKFPEDYQAEDLKGADATFNVKINSIKVKELPEVDDEFAKDVSEFDTVDELKADIKAKLEKAAEEKQKNETENALIEKVTEEVEVEIPDCMIESQLSHIMQDYNMRLMQQGLSLEKYLELSGSTIDSFKEQFKAQATAQVKTTLTLEAIAKAENIEVTDDDVEQEYKSFAESYNMPVEQVQQYIKEEDIKGDLAIKKAVSLVVNSAKIK